MTIQPTIPAPEQLAAELTGYVRDRFLQGDADVALTDRSPLLEWGVLTSLNTVILLTHIREAYGVDVPPTAITAIHLRDTRSIAALVADLADRDR
jgi:acyl carrier protein